MSLNLEGEFGIGPEKAAAIADHFRAADQQYFESAGFGHSDILLDAFGTYYDTFGPVNFAAIEQVFRTHGLHTHFLAVETEQFERLGGVEVVDINDVFANNPSPKPMPYGYLAAASPEQLQDNLRRLRVQNYDPAENLRRLRMAGTVIPKKGPEGQKSPTAMRIN